MFVYVMIILKIFKYLPIAVLLRPSPLYRKCATSCGSCRNKRFSTKYSMPAKKSEKEIIRFKIWKFQAIKIVMLCLIFV